MQKASTETTKSRIRPLRCPMKHIFHHRPAFLLRTILLLLSAMACVAPLRAAAPKPNRQQPFSIIVGFKSPHGPRGGNNLPARLRDLLSGDISRPTPNCRVPRPWQTPDPKTGEMPRGLADNATHLDYLRHIADVDQNITRLLESLPPAGFTQCSRLG